jgi:hypothetical protein
VEEFSLECEGQREFFAASLRITFDLFDAIPAPEIREIQNFCIIPSFCRHLDISTGFAASRNFMEYGIDGRLLGCQNGSVIQLQCHIQVVTLEDMCHLAGVEDMNRHTPNDSFII